jgi:hypothetical protein
MSARMDGSRCQSNLGSKDVSPGVSPGATLRRCFAEAYFFMQKSNVMHGDPAYFFFGAFVGVDVGVVVGSDGCGATSSSK